MIINNKKKCEIALLVQKLLQYKVGSYQIVEFCKGIELLQGGYVSPTGLSCPDLEKREGGASASCGNV